MGEYDHVTMRPFSAVVLRLAGLALALVAVGCGSAPGEDGLRDSFMQQLTANKAVTSPERSGDSITFKGPRGDGTPADWRVQITSASVEPQPDEKQPYKGVVKSSWFMNGEEVKITGSVSNLPIELMSNGLSQECWAFWEADGKLWSWE